MSHTVRRTHRESSGKFCLGHLAGCYITRSVTSTCPHTALRQTLRALYDTRPQWKIHDHASHRHSSWPVHTITFLEKFGNSNARTRSLGKYNKNDWGAHPKSCTPPPPFFLPCLRFSLPLLPISPRTWIIMATDQKLLTWTWCSALCCCVMTAYKPTCMCVGIFKFLPPSRAVTMVVYQFSGTLGTGRCWINEYPGWLKLCIAILCSHIKWKAEHYFTCAFILCSPIAPAMRGTRLGRVQTTDKKWPIGKVAKVIWSWRYWHVTGGKVLLPRLLRQ